MDPSRSSKQSHQWCSNYTWENVNQIHVPDLIKLYHKGNPLQRIKGRCLSLQSPHLPIWQSSRYPLLHSPLILSSLQTTKIPPISLKPSFTHLHSRPTSSTSSMLVGSEITPLGDTLSNIPISAKKHTAATTLRLAWSHPLLYPIHQVQHRPTTRTLPHKFVLTPSLNHQSSIYAPSIDHNDLAHIPDPSSCRQAGLSICPTSRLPNLRFPFQSLTQQLRLPRQCRLGQPSQPLPPMMTLTRYSFTPLRMDSSPPSLITKLIPRCCTTNSPNKSRVLKIASSNMRRPSSKPLRVIPSMMDAFLTFASHVATDSPIWLSGSSLTTTAPHWASWTPMALKQCHTSPTYTPN